MVASPVVDCTHRRRPRFCLTLQVHAPWASLARLWGISGPCGVAAGDSSSGIEGVRLQERTCGTQNQIPRGTQRRPRRIRVTGAGTHSTAHRVVPNPHDARDIPASSRYPDWQGRFANRPLPPPTARYTAASSPFPSLLACSEPVEGGLSGTQPPDHTQAPPLTQPNQEFPTSASQFSLLVCSRVLGLGLGRSAGRDRPIFSGS